MRKLEKERRALVKVGIDAPSPPTRLPTPWSSACFTEALIKPENEIEEGDEKVEVASMMDYSLVKMAMGMGMSIGPSLLEEEWSIVEENADGDASFEFRAPPPVNQSRFNKASAQ